MKKTLEFYALIGVAVFLTIMFIAGQTLSLVDYDLAVSLGLQESAGEISAEGVAFAKGFAFGDTVFYIPLFAIGIVGLLKGKAWGAFSMFGALAVTVYWPVVHLFMLYSGRDLFHLSHDKYLSYSILLPLIALYGLWGMRYLYANQTAGRPGE
jgi:hypothetical protein